MSKAPREYKLTVLGGGAVGKSCLTIRFVENKFPLEWFPTIEDAYVKKRLVDGEEVLLRILDTAGQDDYNVLREQQMKYGDGFLLVYSIESRQSFNELEIFYQQILRMKDSESFPMIIVGTKCDLEYQRQVPSSEARNLARRLGCAFIETSAKERINVDEAFIALVREIKRSQQPAVPPGIDSKNHPAEMDEHSGGCKCIIA